MNEAETKRDAARADEAPEPVPNDAFTWIARVLLLAAIGVAAYLLFGALQGGPIAGCGARGGCDDVLQSHWSRWWKIPITLPALLAYISLLFLSLQRPTPRREAAMLVLCVMIVGAAIWFVGLQYFRIGHYCYFCLTAHGCGAWSALTLRPRIAGRVGVQGISGGVIGLILLCGGQFILPSPTALWEIGGGPDAVVLPAEAGMGRRISMYKGHLELDLNTVPLIGPPDAPHVVVVLFDVTCSHCNELHRELETARLRYGRELAIVALPMPLDPRCNPGVSPDHVGNLNACEYARLALAVWRADRTKYDDFVTYLFDAVPTAGVDGVALAQHQAELLVGEAQLHAALKDTWVEEQLRTDVELYRANNKIKGSTAMPQMVMGDVFMQGAPDTVELEKQMAAFMGR